MMTVVTSTRYLKLFSVFVFMCVGSQVEGVHPAFSTTVEPAGPECHLKDSKVYFSVTNNSPHMFGICATVLQPRPAGVPGEARQILRCAAFP